MSKVIYKYLLTSFTTTVRFPKGGKILTAAMQNDSPVMWVLCDPEVESESHEIRAIATGEPFDTVGQYINTIQSSNGLVWHIFDMIQLRGTQ